MGLLKEVDYSKYGKRKKINAAPIFGMMQTKFQF